MKRKEFRFQVAALPVEMKGSTDFCVPECFLKFQSENSSESNYPENIVSDEKFSSGTELTLHVKDQASKLALSGEKVLFNGQAWHLLQDDAGNYVFVAPQEIPPHHIVVDTHFSTGEVIGDFSYSGAAGMFPLQNLGVRLFTNWLANFGDVLAHSSGVDIDGRGYCFMGHSGAGKSTLVRALAGQPRITVLGEDQVIIRLINERFLLFGTPFHTDPAFCAPGGVPLEKVFFLDRDIPPHLKQLSPLEGVSRMMQIAFIPYYRPEAVSGILDSLSKLAVEVPFFSLNYVPGTDVMKLIMTA